MDKVTGDTRLLLQVSQQISLPPAYLNAPIWPAFAWLNGYSIEGERRTDWFAKGMLKHHRTLATTINALIGAGFELRCMEEFAPTPEQIAEIPALAEELEQPMMLLVSAHKI